MKDDMGIVKEFVNEKLEILGNEMDEVERKLTGDLMEIRKLSQLRNRIQVTGP